MSNHPNRSRRCKPAANPDPAEVRAFRERIQSDRGIRIGAAQDICAAWLCTTRRTWQQWESEKGTNDHRRMHPGFWKLANLMPDGFGSND